MAKNKSIYQHIESKPALVPRESKLQAQEDHLKYWNEKFEKMIHELKIEIMEIIDG